MKISELKKLAWVFFALMLATTTLFAQGRGYRNGMNAQPGTMSCINQISSLTEGQKATITELENAHQETMAQLRTERRSTGKMDEKSLIREEMLEVQAEHRQQVRAQLNEEQQSQYDQIQAAGPLHKYQNHSGRRFYGNRATNDSIRAYGRNFRNAPAANYGRGMGRRGANGCFGRGNGRFCRNRNFNN